MDDELDLLELELELESTELEESLELELASKHVPSETPSRGNVNPVIVIVPIDRAVDFS